MSDIVRVKNILYVCDADQLGTDLHGIAPRDLARHGSEPRDISRRGALILAGSAASTLLLSPLSAGATTVSEEDIADAEAQLEAAEAQLEVINEEYTAIAAELSETRIQIIDVTEKIAAKEAEIDAKQAEIDAKQAEIDAKQEEIDIKQAELEEKQGLLAERVSAKYKEDSSSMLDILLSSKDMSELYENLYYYNKVVDLENDLIEEVREIKAALEVQKAELEVQKEELEVQKEELEAQKAELDLEKAQLEALEDLQEEQYAQAQAKQIEAEELVQSLSDEVQELIATREAELLELQRAAEEARQQALSNASSSGGVIYGTGSLQDVINAAYSTPTTGYGYCAAWVSNVFRNAGVGSWHGNACDLYWNWCYTAIANIQAGMIIAVPVARSTLGRIYGHVAIYVGNGVVRGNEGSIVDRSLSWWVDYFSLNSTPLCGWMGGIQLS